MAASLTIVVPSFDRREHLRALLNSLAAALSEPIDTSIDVLVILDGSTDRSGELLEELADGFPVPLHGEWQQNRGRAAARNAGVRAATGDLVWLLDDDMVVDREALLAHLAHDRKEAPLLAGPCHVQSPDPQVANAYRWYQARHDRLAAERWVTNPSDCSFANLSAPTALLRKHQFDEDFRGYGLEDYELGIRLITAGVRIAFDPRAAVVHNMTASLSETLRKLREEGVNRVRLTRMHPTFGHVAFPPGPGRAERALRQAARLPAGAPLWCLARLLAAATGATHSPLRQQALRRYSMLAATYSGVAAELSRPDGDTPRDRSRRSLRALMRTAGRDRVPGSNHSSHTLELRELAELWDLDIGSRVEHDGETATIHLVTRRDGSRAVLKVSTPGIAVAQEAEALELVDGTCAIRVFESYPSRGALLLERVESAKSLAGIENRESAIDLAVDILVRWWRDVPSARTIATVQQSYASDHSDLVRHAALLSRRIPVNLVEQALEVLTDPGSESVLLHADLHLGNVLWSDRGWVAIDPQPVIGPRAFDLEPLVRDARAVPASLARARLARIAERAGVERHEARRAVLARGLVVGSWAIQSGSPKWGWRHIHAIIAATS